jgi:hypothetical protein
VKKLLLYILFLVLISGCIEPEPPTSEEIVLAQEWVNTYHKNATNITLFRDGSGRLHLDFNIEQRQIGTGRIYRHYYYLNKDGTVTYGGVKEIKDEEIISWGTWK